MSWRRLSGRWRRQRSTRAAARGNAAGRKKARTSKAGTTRATPGMRPSFERGGSSRTDRLRTANPAVADDSKLELPWPVRTDASSPNAWLWLATDADTKLVPCCQARLTFRDDTDLVVFSRSSIKLDQFLLSSPDRARSVVFSTSDGNFAFNTGHSPHEAYLIDTTAGTLKPQGTRFRRARRAPEARSAGGRCPVLPARQEPGLLRGGAPRPYRAGQRPGAGNFRQCRTAWGPGRAPDGHHPALPAADGKIQAAATRSTTR